MYAKLADCKTVVLLYIVYTGSLAHMGLLQTTNDSGWSVTHSYPTVGSEDITYEHDQQLKAPETKKQKHKKKYDDDTICTSRTISLYLC